MVELATTYTVIPNEDVDAESPITQSLAFRWRDNPLAIMQGNTEDYKVICRAVGDGNTAIWSDASPGDVLTVTSESLDGGYLVRPEAPDPVRMTSARVDYFSARVQGSTATKTFEQIPSSALQAASQWLIPNLTDASPATEVADRNEMFQLYVIDPSDPDEYWYGTVYRVELKDSDTYTVYIWTEDQNGATLPDGSSTVDCDFNAETLLVQVTIDGDSYARLYFNVDASGNASFVFKYRGDNETADYTEVRGGYTILWQ